MKKAILALTLCAISASSFAATEISKKESVGLKSLGRITVIENTITGCLDGVSTRADAKGAPYFVVLRAGDVGKGANAQITAELFTK